MPQNNNAFSIALTLLTRFGHAKIIDDKSLTLSRPWFAVVGALLGLIYFTVIYILYALTSASAWLLAWLYIALDIYSTRALHYDGLADVGDAVGSGVQGEKFWNIMHDSRLGAFGAIALIMSLGIQFFSLQDLIQKELWYALIIAPIFGRILCVFMCNLSKPYNPHSFGGKMCTSINYKLCLTYFLLSFFLLLPLGFHFSILALLVGTVLIYYLVKIAKFHGGCNGDFLGTSIIAGQCLLLLLCSML